MKKQIYPCLWFNGNAREAAEFYCSVLENTSITSDNQIVVMIESNGQKIMCLNGGPEYNFTPAVSFVVECDTQEEIDYYWDRLTEGGEEVQCGWLKDKFGVSWQVVPTILSELMSDPSRSQRVVNAFLKMKKFDIEKLLNA